MKSSTTTAEGSDEPDGRRHQHNQSCAAWIVLLLSLLLISATPAPAATNYVWQRSTNPMPPYSSWETAATNIQDAVDAAQAGDTVLVTNGVYASGGRVDAGNVTNRLVIDKPIYVRGVAGPEVTVISGAAQPEEMAVRCVYLASNAVLSGFTLTAGRAPEGAGVLADISALASNCLIIANSASGYGGGANSGIFAECTFRNNSARMGGGSHGSTLRNCTLIGNYAYNGGGSAYGTLFNSVISGNSSPYGGGAFLSTLYNCTVTGNSADYAGGVWGSDCYNCIVYHNRGARYANYSSSSVFEYSCSSPLASGPGNIDADPRLASISHISGGSPCIGAGSAAYASGRDIDDQPWQSPPCIGADQHRAGEATGQVQVMISAAYTNIATGFAVPLAGLIDGQVTDSRWDFGEGTILSNAPYATHNWKEPGVYQVQLTAWNDSHPSGVSAFCQVQVREQSVYYVNQANTSPAFPYTSWDSAATNIQDAIDAGSLGGRLVLVTNGLYATGGRAVSGNMTNRVVVSPGVVVQSINGPAVTVIQGTAGVTAANGDGAIRCVYLGSNAVLSGFTLTNGFTRASGDGRKETVGGGVWSESCGIVTNCVLSRNSSYNWGGGAFSGTLQDCVLTGNSALLGGGASSSLLDGCAVLGNIGAGAYESTLSNCVVTGNTQGAERSLLYNCTVSTNSAGGVESSTLYDCNLAGNSWTAAIDSKLYRCTLTGNQGSQAAGAQGGTLVQCTVFANAGAGCVAGTLQGCTVISNSGGGVFGCTLNDCALIGNSKAGGANASILTNCTLEGNTSTGQGGGANNNSILVNCTLEANSGLSGGGAANSTLYNCILKGNTAIGAGGGSYSCTLFNCVLTGNSTSESDGGGSYSGTLIHCTLTGNWAARLGGGAYDATLGNCIVYYNSAANGSNYYYLSAPRIAYSCSVPVPAGVGNIGADPQLASAAHLSSNSPCIGTGDSAGTTGTDIDGESWLAPPAMGADQLIPGQVTGPLSISISAVYTNVAVGFELSLIAQCEGRILASRWDFGDGTSLTNAPYATHTWSNPGLYPVILTGYSDAYPGGVSATVLVQVASQSIYYVNAANPAPMPPHQSWETAATSIQDAIDAGNLPGRLVLVTNGLYSTGGRESQGRLTNRIILTEAARVQSVNGPAVTWILGGAAAGGVNGPVRCAWVGSNAVLSGFTLNNGHTLLSGSSYEKQGGGVWCEQNGIVTNCLLIKNSATSAGGGACWGRLDNCLLKSNSIAGPGFTSGAGAYAAILNHCALIGNLGSDSGGGAYAGTVNDCILLGNASRTGAGAKFCTILNSTLVGNSARTTGGAAEQCRLYNCIAYYNTAPSYPNLYFEDCSFCCTTPKPSAGIGHITSEPAFVNLANGNLRLSSNSPCINAGNNAYVASITDLDGNARIAGGTVDIGAYEFQTPGSQLSYAWLQNFGVPTDGSADSGDPDGDGLNNSLEWLADTDPTNALSLLRIERITTSLPLTGNPPVTVTFQSSSNRFYSLEYSALAASNVPPSWVNVPGQSGIVGLAGTMPLRDTNAVAPRFYRVRAGME